MLTHFGWHYVNADDPQTQGRVFYIMRGVLGAALALLVTRPDRTTGLIVLFACYVDAFMETQTAACGLSAWGKDVGLAGHVVHGVCVDQFGVAPYLAGGVAMLGVILSNIPEVRQWLLRNWRKFRGLP